MLVWFVDDRRARACRTIAARTRGARARSNPAHARPLLRRQRRARLPRARLGRSSSSPAARRSTPTWATSARGRSASPGSRSSSRRLLLNYFGQGALLLSSPGDAIANPFFALVAGCAALPAGRARDRCATVIASQALISGAFSLTQQAVQLGYLPRVTIVHTSATRAGPDLHPGGQLAADGRVHRAVVLGFEIVEQARGGVRHRGHRHDGDHDDPVLRRRAAALGLARSAAALLVLVALPDLRPRVLRRERRQDRRTAAGSRSSLGARHVHRDDHVVARAGSSCRASSTAARSAARPVPRRPRRAAAAPRAAAPPCS